jgi:hypothetical protein
MIEVAPCTTWLLVRMKPSGVKTTPEPAPIASRAGPLPPVGTGTVTCRWTTAGATLSTAPITARE